MLRIEELETRLELGRIYKLTRSRLIPARIFRAIDHRVLCVQDTAAARFLR